MTNARYINDMIIRFYSITRTIRELEEDTDSFAAESRTLLVQSLITEREKIWTMLDEELRKHLAS